MSEVGSQQCGLVCKSTNNVFHMVGFFEVSPLELDIAGICQWGYQVL